MYGRPAGSPYGSTYGNTYGSSMYGSSPYGVGGMYGSGMYGGGSMYGSSPYSSSLYNSSSMYGGGMYGGLYNRGMGSNMGMYSSPYGSGYSGYGIPNSMGMPGNLQGPLGAPGNMIQPPRTKWQMTLDSLHGLMTFFGRISMLMDENAHAVHFFITALLQLLDRASFLWGEIARFVLRLLGYRKPLARPGSVGASMGETQKGAVAVVPQRDAVNDLERVWKGN
jgi:peroxin-13